MSVEIERKKLEEKRASLKPLYIQAKNNSDTAEMGRLRQIAVEIDKALDDLVFWGYHNDAAQLEKIAKDIAAAKKRALEFRNFIPDLSIDADVSNSINLSEVPEASFGADPQIDQWDELVSIYRNKVVEFEHLKAVTLAQWIIESGRGRSSLAKDHKNYAGMKWRSEMQPFGQRVLYHAHDGPAYYTKFNDLDSFIDGFWAFLERSPYQGWREHASTPESFIDFIGPIWAEDTQYADKVLGRLYEAESLLGLSSEEGLLEGNEQVADELNEDASDSVDGGFLLPGRPSLSLSADHNIAVGSAGLEILYEGVDTCPYGKTATKNKQPFSAIVIHHTADHHSAEWYVKYQIDGDPQRGGHFGYHFYLAQDGTIFQGAPLGKRTNHISPKSGVRYPVGRHIQNINSIGVACVGAWNTEGFNPSDQQVQQIDKLIFALSDLYSIPFKNVFGHGELQSNRKRVEGTSLAKKIRSW